MKLSEKIRKLRTEKGVTQTQLAEAIGVSMRMVQEYETNGRYPRNRAIYKEMADYFGVDLNYLLTEDEEFTTSAAEKYGYNGAKQAEELVAQVKGLFAGGEMADEDKDIMMKAIQDAYWDAKEKNKKYAPAKTRKNS
jgi:transcriptional regulator with XRE-family HTH domain